MKSLYGQYIEEVAGKQIIETEFGFATFYIIPNSTACYIEDIYVVPEHRETSIGTDFEREVTNWAKQNGCTELIASVNTKIKTPERSMAVILKRKFKFSHVSGDMIFFAKDI